MNELIETIFTKVPPVYFIIGSTVLALFMGTMALIVRTKAAKRPVYTNENHLAAAFHVNRCVDVHIRRISGCRCLKW